MSIGGFIAPAQPQAQPPIVTGETVVLPQLAPPTFPVSFIVICSTEDLEYHIEKMLHTVPQGAEVCIVTNSQGETEELTETRSEWQDGLLIRTRHWTYTGMFHFANARNHSQDMATNDWVFWLDADDRLAACQHDTIRKATDLPAGYGGVMVCCTSMHMPVPPHTEYAYSAVTQCRMYRRSTGARWVDRVHEQIWDSIKAMGFTGSFSVITVIHVGYSDDMVKLLARNRRNIELKLLDIVESGGIYGPRMDYKLGILSRDINSLKALER